MRKRTCCSLSWFYLNRYLIIFYSGATQLQIKPKLLCRVRCRLARSIHFFSVSTGKKHFGGAFRVALTLSPPCTHPPDQVGCLALVMKYQPSCTNAIDQLSFLISCRVQKPQTLILPLPLGSAQHSSGAPVRKADLRPSPHSSQCQTSAGTSGRSKVSLLGC